MTGTTTDVPQGWADVLFDKAFALNEEREALMAATKANRDSLRSLAVQGLLTKDEIATLNDLYPVRKRTRKGEGEK